MLLKVCSLGKPSFSRLAAPGEGTNKRNAACPFRLSTSKIIHPFLVEAFEGCCDLFKAPPSTHTDTHTPTHLNQTRDTFWCVLAMNLIYSSHDEKQTAFHKEPWSFELHEMIKKKHAPIRQGDQYHQDTSRHHGELRGVQLYA